MIEDRFHGLQLAIFSWTFVAGLIGVLGALTASDKTRLFIASTTCAALVCGITAGWLATNSERRMLAVAALGVSAAATPAWMLWPVPVIGGVLAVVLFVVSKWFPMPVDDLGCGSVDDVEGQATLVGVDEAVAEIAARTRAAIESARRREQP